MSACFFIPPDEYAQRSEERIRRVHEEQFKLQDLTWEDMCKLPQFQQLFTAQFFGIGAMWFCPWWWDPADHDEARRGKCGLSSYYWRDWADKRPPIMVVTPAYREWCIDQKSSNGEGWVVTGEPPLVTCAPSIDVPGYHGFLRDGVFTPPL